jgi:hypothetical protein
MIGLAKVRTLWILGVMLVCLGALIHSHADSWATYVVTTTLSSSGKMEVVDYPLDYLFVDMGLAMMALGGIAFTLGIIGWLYPSRTERDF